MAIMTTKEQFNGLGILGLQGDERCLDLLHRFLLHLVLQQILGLRHLLLAAVHALLQVAHALGTYKSNRFLPSKMEVHNSFKYLYAMFLFFYYYSYSYCYSYSYSTPTTILLY